jgi:hypothetical protein
MNYLDPAQSIRLANQRLEMLHHEAQIEHAIRELRGWTWFQLLLSKPQTRRSVTPMIEPYIPTKWGHQ